MIHVEHLVKRYGRQTAVDDISFTCRPGTITGFLGPNGAGKSTTLRMMTGLTPPSAGRVTIDGIPYASHPNPGRVIGVMLDASAQHPGRSGIETLRLTARLLGLPGPRHGDARAGRSGRCGQAPRRRLLARHAPAARDRDGADGRPRRADPRRAGQRHGPRGHPLDADAPARLRGRRRHGAAVEPPPRRGAGDRGPARRHRSVAASSPTTPSSPSWPGRGRRSGGSTPPPSTGPCAPPGSRPRRASSGALRVQATAEQVGRVALASRQVLLELHEGDSSGLEELFFELTASPTDDGQATAA